MCLQILNKQLTSKIKENIFFYVSFTLFLFLNEIFDNKCSLKSLVKIC